jgi:hypothetical protein
MLQFLMQWMWICALTANVYFLKHVLEETQDRMEMLRGRIVIIETRRGECEDGLAQICSNMQADIEAYDGDETDMKRRMRGHFEMAMKTKEGEAMSSRMQQWELFWGLVCSEVCLKICTQIAKSRMLTVLMLKAVEHETLMKETKTLQTLKMHFCQHWIPFGAAWRAMNGHVSDSIVVHILKFRIKEMQYEIVQCAFQVKNQMQFDLVFAGMPLLVQVILDMHIAPYSMVEAEALAEKCRKRTRTEESEE